MRFATKILLLTLAMTVGLSGVVAVVVTRRIRASEIERAGRTTLRAIEDYADRVNERDHNTRRLAQSLLEDPLVRSYLEEILATPGDDLPEAGMAQLREEIFGRTLQTELAFKDVRPGFHVLVGRRGRTILLAGPGFEKDSALNTALRALRWPHDVVLEASESEPPPQLRVVALDRLYHVFSIPLRTDLQGSPEFAYFVGYEVDDAWVRAFARPTEREDLRVVVLLERSVIARSQPADDVERALVEHLHGLRPSDQQQLMRLDFSEARTAERFIGEALVLPAGSGATIAFFSSLDRALGTLRSLQRAILFTTIGVVVVAVGVAQMISWLLAKPVEQLVAGTERIARGEFNVTIDVHRRDELGQLARSFNEMAAGLAQRDLIKDTFGKFVDPTIVQSLLDDPARLKLGGERRLQTILFADLENFTSLAERLDPEAMFRLLNVYLEDSAEVITAHRGIVDKFIGDGVVAFWGPPLEQEHAPQACRAALELVRRTARHDGLCAQWGLPPLRARVGIATGEVLVGNIGSKSKYNYTVMGDIANLASRLEGANKIYGTQILASAETVQSAAETILARLIDVVRVVGRIEPVELHEILGTADDGSARVAGIEPYRRARELYSARRWTEARSAFEAIGEAPARVLAERCAALAARVPSGDWDGIWNLDSK